MHDDETRSDAEIELLRSREIASDPLTFLRAHDALQARERKDRARIKELEKALETEKKSARWQKAKRDELREHQTAQEKAWQAERADLLRRLGEAHGKLQAYVRECKRLREDLERVRGSRTFKIGKAVMKPVTIFRGGPSAPSGPASAVTEAPDSSTSGESSTAGTPAPATPSKKPVESQSPEKVSAASRVAAPPVPVGQRDLDTLRREFAEDPNPTTLYRVINRTWFQHGMIEEPARLIDEHPELVEAFGEKEMSIAERVLGDRRLRSGVVEVPPRALGAAYLPEPGRLMYCVYSTPVFNSNGYSTRTRGIAKGMLDCGIDVRVVARSGYPWDQSADRKKPPQKRSVETLDGVQYVHLPGSALGAVPMDRYLIEAADSFTREARLQRPSTIQAASNYRTALPALIAARRVGVPFVYEVRGFWELSQAAARPTWEDSEQYRTIADQEILVAREADHVLAITRQVKDDLIARGVPADRITVAPNAVDTREFAPLPKDTQYAAGKKIRTDVPVIGFAGSMVTYEGLSTLLDASMLLVERGVEHQVVLAGSGSEEKALQQQREQLGASQVAFLGRLPMEEMPRLLSTFDIVPLPRLSHGVTEMVSPLKPLEAFASMKAVALSDVAPHLDLAGSDQERALIFRAGDVASMADVLERLIRDTDLRQDLGRAGRLWTLDERTWTAVAVTMQAAHVAARLAHERSTPTDGPALKDVTVGLIADEFTTKTLAASLDVIRLDRDRWRSQLESTPVDLVLVESAWEGNGGQWRRGVGAYEPEEHQDIRDLLAHCREAGIRTAFWNKEDPIHIARFRPTAALCDHVFTTDANMIQRYLSTPGAATRTAAAMPFYAQPALHNPLPGQRTYRHTAAYAGTYYGDRYKERSRELYRMLETASAFGLTIYDRQAAYPDSPYRFPAEFQQYSEGALPYDEVIDSYKSHVAHLNGNSVMDSPTMFSRRVVEIAACGGIALSGPGRGVEETFGGMIPVSKDAQLWRTLLHAWTTDPTARVREAWRQMRAVHRSHTVDAAMTVLLRTTGIAVTAPQLDSYSVVLTEASSELVRTVLRQSRRPLEVFVPGGDSEASAPLAQAGIAVRDSGEAGRSAAQWIGIVDSSLPRTWFEDLLLATRFGQWDRLDVAIADEASQGRTLAAQGAIDGSTRGLVRSDRAASYVTVEDALRDVHGAAVSLLVAPPLPSATGAAEDDGLGNTKTVPQTVLVAGHDLKFAGTLISSLEQSGHTVLIDQWKSHTQHDEERSKELLARASTVFCEWGLGNAVWYSQHVSSQQRLVVRVHSQELYRPYLRRIKTSAVSAFVFVGELIRRAAIESHGIPESRSHVVPNFVDVRSLQKEKSPDARFHLGFVGMVPRSKRLDRALDVLERLLRRDARYRLFIKGKRPEDYPWMAQRAEEMAYYGAIAERIDTINAQFPGAVCFDEYGDDMPEWFQKIGVAISVSDFESFHYTVADGAVSGAVPVSLAWPGSDFLYPRPWLSANSEEMAERILSHPHADPEDAEFVRRHYDVETTVPALLELIAPAAG